MSPSAASRPIASRIGVRLTSSAAERCLSSRRSPGVTSPSRMNSRSRLYTLSWSVRDPIRPSKPCTTSPSLPRPARQEDLTPKPAGRCARWHPARCPVRWMDTGVARIGGSVEAVRRGSCAPGDGGSQMGPVDLPFDLHGSGDLRVVMIHGWFADRTTFQAVTPHLDGETFTYAIPDLRGYGEAKRILGEYTMAE